MRVSQPLLYSISFSVDTYRLGEQYLFYSQGVFQSLLAEIGANKFPSLLVYNSVNLPNRGDYR